MRKTLAAVAALLVAVACATGAPRVAEAEGTVNVYRLYNQWTGEHLYTTSHDEYMKNGGEGWTLEGVGWTAPEKSNTPVYRLYNQWSGEHHYTTDGKEYDELGVAGWSQEGEAWYSDDAKAIPVYRLYNPFTGAHHFTTDKGEYDDLGANGWRREEVAWHGTGAGWPESYEVQHLGSVQGWWTNYSERHYMDGGVDTIKSHTIHIVNDRAYIYRTTIQVGPNGLIGTEVTGPESLGTVSTVGVGRNIKVTCSADPQEYCYYWWSGARDNLSKDSSGFMDSYSLVRTPENQVPQDYLSRVGDER